MESIVNGKFSDLISAADRGLNYGDGVFTTLLVRAGQPIHFEEHQHRLEQGCHRLGITPPDWMAMAEQVSNLAQNQSLAVLKVVVTRGVGGRGYSPTGATNTSVVVSRHNYPSQYNEWQNGIELGVAETRCAVFPSLAGLKHLNRLDNVLIKQEIDERRLVDAVVLDADEMLVSASAANLFWYKDSCWYTPSVERAGIAGITRNRVLSYFVDNDIDCKIVRECLDKLLSAEHIFICNTLMGLVPVIKINQQQFKRPDLTELRKAVIEQ
jgi:4-amino-4-deoxychorismate lyase